jgi:ABC-2 type transport system ATP-binding protein
VSITVTNLSKSYGLQKAVNDISFSINKGEIVGFLGPNGAGKSTTMKMITGYLSSNSGSIEVCGMPVVENNVQTKKKIGYLPESNPLYFDMYIREYLSFVAQVFNVKNKKQKIEEVIQLVGLSNEANKKIVQLSKGYKQRVGLAAALIHDPEVLILDEPTSGLDPNQILEIREVIKRLGEHKTILFSSHIMQEVEAICNRVIIINKGKIVADDLLSNLQKGKAGMHFVSVVFKEKTNVELLSKLTDCNQITFQNECSFTIETNHPESIRKQIMQLSLDNGWNIISLNSEKQQLEEIFKSLTNIKNN